MMARRRLLSMVSLVPILLIMTTLPALCFWYAVGTPPVAKARGSGPGSNNSGNLIYVPVGVTATFFDYGSTDVDEVCDPVYINDGIGFWKWNFGDGSPEKTGRSVTHEFKKHGTYVVKLTVDDNPSYYFNDGPVISDSDNSVTVKVWDATISKHSEGWLPTADDTLSFTLNFRPSDIEGSFEVLLDNVSALPGKCSNAACDNTANETAPDLQILAQSGWSVNPASKNWAYSSNPTNQATLAVTCLDYGARGSISATAHRLGVDIAVIVEGTDVDPDLVQTAQGIPMDANSNFIADAWPYDKRPDGTDGYSSDDEENTPLGLSTGDGFSRFDEYRGFMLGGSHTRTDANTKKDVYIRDEDNLGLGSFGTLGLETHIINDSEWDSASHAVNFNGTGGQCGILLLDGVFDQTKEAGWCYPDPGTPCSVTKVEVYTQWIHDYIDSENDYQDVLSQVIAHELAHAVSVVHHDPINLGSPCIMKYPCPKNSGECVSSFCTSLPGCARKTKLTGP